ncbi:hypothetical protein SDC9_166469 [bioreactor metagenome]|uniref:ComE operon protein 3 n=1 Tax=bioreactor metagenome TaxID=1076179 RepID=A0A645G505_9ZZZZ
MDALQSDYDVKSVITGKQAEITKGQLVIHGLLTETYSNNENDNSQIWYLEWHGLRYLLLGDISSEMERELVRKYPKLQADIVKLAHHGSSTSSSDYLLRNIQPQLAVISSGYQNRYHHPSPEVIQRLQDYRINYFNTAEVGDIQIIFGYFFNLLHTSKDEFVIIRSVIT